MGEKVSVIIATLGREAELATTLGTVRGGTVKPNEIIVVDGTAGRTAEPVVGKFAADSDDTEFVYVHTKPGLPGQRNAGLERASGDIILFLDDDVVLEADFLVELLSAYRDPGVGGATGLIINQAPTPGWLAVLRSIFLLTRYARRCYQQPSGLPAFLYKPRVLTEVGILNGCNMSFRRRAMNGFRFDPRVNYFDDDDVSLTVGARWRLVQVPTARLRHVVSPKGRRRAPAVADRSIVEQRLLHRKHLAQTPLNVLAYYWSVVGSALVAAVRLHPRVCLRTLLGLRAVLTGADKKL